MEPLQIKVVDWISGSDSKQKLTLNITFYICRNKKETRKVSVMMVTVTLGELHVWSSRLHINHIL